MNKYGCLFIAAIVMMLACAGSNNTPTINSVTATPNSIYPGQTSTLACNATDEDGDVITYHWTAEAGNLSATDLSSVIWVPPQDTGVYTMQVIVEDEDGLADTGSVDVRLNPNWVYGENVTVVPIYDFTWSFSEIIVSGVPSGAEVDTVTIGISISHTFPSDLDIWLESPDGTQLLICDNTYPGGIAIFTTDLLAGKPVNGTWTLWVYDEVAGDEGTLNEWDILIQWKF